MCHSIQQLQRSGLSNCCLAQSPGTFCAFTDPQCGEKASCFFGQAARWERPGGLLERGLYIYIYKCMYIFIYIYSYIYIYIYHAYICISSPCVTIIITIKELIAWTNQRRNLHNSGIDKLGLHSRGYPNCYEVGHISHDLPIGSH